MAPRKKFEFVILRLKFLPFVHPENPQINLSRKRRIHNNAMTQVRDWFDRVMSEEKSKIPPNLYVRYCEWNITSGNGNLFFVNGFRYDKIILVLSEDVVHWIYYKNVPFNKRLEGCGNLPVNYCGCCLSTQYIQIMEKVQGCVMNRNGCN